MKAITVLLLFLAGVSTPVNASPPAIAVSIKPLHSLVSAITEGVSEPQLILSSNTDPHHFSMRPSQVKLIQQAQLVVWAGPELEASLSKTIQRSNAKKLTLLDIELPALYATRLHGNDEAQATGKTDPHIWLSPDNAVHISKLIADTLKQIDPANSNRYQKNLDNSIENIDQLSAEIEFELSLPNKRYIAYHDAYQYFEKHFGLIAAGAIKNSHAVKTGPAHISKLKHLIDLQDANCIVYDTSEQPAIIDSLGKTERTRIQHIDILGRDIAAGSELWFDLMRDMASGFRQCLQ